jgi:anthranilate phosphoribosyltransferase
MEDRFRALLDKASGAITGRPPTHLTIEEAEWAMSAMLEGAVSLPRLTAMLLALRAKGPTAEELAGSARAARARVRFPELPAGAVVISTSRRGKVRSPPLGLAAAAAAAACGARVLVQASPGYEGSGVTLGDVWECAGGTLDAPPEAVADSLTRNGLACWRPQVGLAGWQAMLDVEPDLGLRLLPDVIGKLLLPPQCRVLVAAMPGPVLGRAGEALQVLGHPRALIVQGVEGSVDAALTRATRGLRLDGGVHAPLRLRCEDYGMLQASEPALPALPDRAQAGLNGTRMALMGGGSPHASVAALGAALILSLLDDRMALAEGVARAQETLDSGAAQARWDAALTTLGSRSP